MGINRLFIRIRPEMAVRIAHSELGTWEKVAKCFGVMSGGYWWLVWKGKQKPNKEAVKAMRKAFGYPPVVKRRPKDLFATPVDDLIMAYRARTEVMLPGGSQNESE